MMKSCVLALLLLVAQSAAQAQVSWTEINHSYFLDNRVVECLMFDERNVFYAGSWNGLHTSLDNGVTWTPIEYFNQIDVSDIVQNHKGYLYVAGWRQSGSPAGVEGVWRSKDHGGNWEIVTAKDWASIRAYSVVVLDGDVLVAGTDDGFLRSMDDGDTWTLTNGRFHPFAPYALGNVNTLYRTPNNTLFAQIGGPIFGRSTNGGTVWSLVLDSINYQAEMSIDSAGRIFVPGDSGVYRSLDNGETWDLKRIEPNQQLYSLSLAASNGWIFGLGARPIISTDHGESWREIRSGLSWEYNASAAVESPDHYVYFVQPTGALWRTKDPIPTSSVLCSTNLKVELYPNPASTEFSVTIAEPLVRLELTNVTGRVVLRKQCNLQHSESISLNGIAAGLYLVRVYGRSGEAFTREILVR